jgi:hypothetical protein
MKLIRFNWDRTRKSVQLPSLITRAIVVLTAACLFLCFAYIPPAKAAFSTGWSRKCELQIQSSKVDDALRDFPVLLTEDTLPSEMLDADGSNPALDGGGDVRFSLNADGTHQLACEIVTFTTDNNPGNGVAEI